MGSKTSCIRHQSGHVDFEQYTPTKMTGSGKRRSRSEKKEKQQWREEGAELNQLTNGDERHVVDAKEQKEATVAPPLGKAPPVPLPGKGKVSELRKMYTEMGERIQDEEQQMAQWRAKRSPNVNTLRDNEQIEVEYLKEVILDLKKEIIELMQSNDRIQKELDSSYATCYKLLLHTDNGSVLMQMKSAYNQEQGRLGNIIGEQRKAIKALKSELKVLKLQKGHQEAKEQH